MTNSPAEQIAVAEAEKVLNATPGIVECAAAYAAIFSHPPFSDKWYVDGEDMSFLVQSPNANVSFIRKTAEYGEDWEDFPEGEQEVTISGQILIPHLKKILEDPMLGEFVAAETITQENINWMRGVIEADDLERKYRIRMDWPINKTINHYNDVARDPDSLITLGIIRDGKRRSIALTPDTILPEGDFSITHLLRVQTYKADHEGGDIHDGMREELALFLADADLAEVVGQIDPKIRTAYLGEIGKIRLAPGSELRKPLEGLVGECSLQYLMRINDLEPDTGMMNMLRSLKKFIRGEMQIPEQLVWLTMPGTKVAEGELSNTLSSIAERFGFTFNTKTIKKPYERDPKMGKVEINILKRVPKE